MRVETITPDGGVIKYIMQEGKGSLIENTDVIYYKHEIRYDSGQLVKFNLYRKVGDEFEINSPNSHDFYKVALRTMRRGEIAWFKYSPTYHMGVYFTMPNFQKKSEEDRAKIGQDVFLKFNILRIKKNPVCEEHEKSTFTGICDYGDRVMKICIECI